LIPENWGIIDQKKALIERNILFVADNISNLIQEMTDIYLGIHAIHESIESLRYSVNNNSAILERIDKKISASIYPVSLKVLEDSPYNYRHQYLLNLINKYIKENPNDRPRLLIADMKLPLIKIRNQWFIESEMEFKRQLHEMSLRGYDKLSKEVKKAKS